MTVGQVEVNCKVTLPIHLYLSQQVGEVQSLPVLQNGIPCVLLSSFRFNRGFVMPLRGLEHRAPDCRDGCKGVSSIQRKLERGHLTAHFVSSGEASSKER